MPVRPRRRPAPHLLFGPPGLTAPRWLVALLLAGLLVPAVALADPEASAKAGWKTLAEGHAAEALAMAETGLVEKVLTKLIYLKAVALWKLTRVEEAWAVIQLVQPGTLPVELQASFPTDFEAIEQGVKDAKVAREQRKALDVQAEAQRTAAADARATRTSRAFWLLIGGVALGGGGGGAMVFGVEKANDAAKLNLADATKHADYHDAFSSGRMFWYAGAAGVAAGAGLAIWGLADLLGADAAEPAPTARLAPWATPDSTGLAFTGRF